MDDDLGAIGSGGAMAQAAAQGMQGGHLPRVASVDKQKVPQCVHTEVGLNQLVAWQAGAWSWRDRKHPFGIFIPSMMQLIGSAP